MRTLRMAGVRAGSAPRAVVRQIPWTRRQRLEAPTRLRDVAVSRTTVRMRNVYTTIGAFLMALDSSSSLRIESAPPRSRAARRKVVADGPSI